MINIFNNMSIYIVLSVQRSQTISFLLNHNHVKNAGSKDCSIQLCIKVVLTDSLQKLHKMWNTLTGALTIMNSLIYGHFQ